MKWFKIIISVYILQLLAFAMLSTIPVKKSVLDDNFSMKIYKKSPAAITCIPIVGLMAIFIEDYTACVIDAKSGSEYVVSGFDTIGDVGMAEARINNLGDGLIVIEFGAEHEYRAIFKR